MSLEVLLPTVVRFRWVDSSGDADTGWHGGEELRGEESCHCVSGGLLAGENNDTITIVNSLDVSNGNYFGRITVPKVSIIGEIERWPDPSVKPSKPRATRGRGDRRSRG